MKENMKDEKIISEILEKSSPIYGLIKSWISGEEIQDKVTHYEE